MLLLGLALWNPGWRSSFSPMKAIIVLDESRSMGANYPVSAWQSSAASLAKLPPGSHYSLIRFGADTVLEVDDRPITELVGQPARPRTAVLDNTGTNIEAALLLAAQQIDSETPELVLLITDGGQTDGDATAFLSRLQTMGLPGPYLFPSATDTSGPDAAINALNAPSEVPFGSETTLVVKVKSNQSGAVRIQVRKNFEAAATVVADLVKDQESSVYVPIGFNTPGVQELEVSIFMPGDMNAANDRRHTIVNVDGPTTIQYVTSKGSTAVTKSLLAGGWNLSIVRPEHFPQVLPLPSGPTTVFLDDVAIGDMPEPVWMALTESVRTRGTGLIVLGGQRSFGAGDYLGSTLESALPVTSEAGSPMSRAAVLFVVDRSGSMGRESGDVTPFGLAKSAVVAATNLLGEHDLSGIIAFDIEPETWLTLADRDDPATSVMRAWKDTPSGGTSIAPALMVAAGQLRDVDVDQRLLLLVTDGFTVEDDYTDVLARIDEYEIEVIALAIGDEPGIDFLEALTARNNGLLLRVSDVAMLPRLASEAVGSRRLTYDSSVTLPRPERVLPFIPDNERPWPELNGYMVTKERANSRVYLRSERGDPLLADHDFGLGRVVVLPGGLGSYARTWPNWRTWAEFLGGSVEWASNRLSDDRVYIRITEEHGRSQLEIDALSTDGDWQSMGSARVSLVDPFGRITVLNAEAFAPGMYRTELPLRHTGRHRATVQVGGIAKLHEFFYEAPAELSATSLGDKVTKGWLEEELVQPWSAENTIQTLVSATERSTRTFFIAMAILLYLGILLSMHAQAFQNWRRNHS